jgi:hypothetical protein
MPTHRSFQTLRTPASPSLHRVPAGRFPGFTSTTGRSDSLPPVPPRFVAFAWRYRALRSSLRSRRRPSATAAGQGFLCPVTPRSGPVRRRQGLPGSWGTPLCACPALRPRWDLRARPSRRFGTAFRDLKRVGSHDHPFSRLNHTACTLAVYASSLRSPIATQDSLPAAGQLCRAGLLTRWVPNRVSELVTSLPPCPGFTWRT